MQIILIHFVYIQIVFHSPTHKDSHSTYSVFVFKHILEKALAKRKKEY